MHELLWAVLHAAAQLAVCEAGAAFLAPDVQGRHVWDLAGVSTARVLGAGLHHTVLAHPACTTSAVLMFRRDRPWWPPRRQQRIA